MISNMVTLKETETLLSESQPERTVRNSVCPSSARKPFKFYRTVKAFFFSLSKVILQVLRVLLMSANVFCRFCSYREYELYSIAFGLNQDRP